MQTEGTQNIQKRVARLLESARRKLVETGTRNRLIHVNRTNKRANALNIINERSEDVFRLLRADSKRMRFHATGKDADEEQDELHLVEREESPPDENRYLDLVLETPLGAEALQRRLLRLYTDANTAEEEQGINILYLAMGFLSWFEDKSSTMPREAPLILLPVELVRNERGSTFDIRCRDDDVVTNLPLQERLKADFGIQLPEIDDSESWTPATYFAQVELAVAFQPRWRIDSDGMQLGFFSFAKLLMLHDLDPVNWPGVALATKDLIQRILQNGFDQAEPLFGRTEKLDPRLDPANLIQVVDADASQTRVIEEVRAGRNLVVQGPPGTGKSQTITNIIASAVHDGKSVLFMAEKMAALDVVHTRLRMVGLNDISLELHSRYANKKAVLQELGRTLASGSSVPGQPPAPEALRRTRDQLNRIAELLHVNLPGRDYSPFSAMAEISELFGRQVPPPTLKAAGLHLLKNDDRNRLIDNITAFRDIFYRTGPSRDHPFVGTGALDLQPTELQRLEQELSEVQTSIEAVLTAATRAASRLARRSPESSSDVVQLATLIDHARLAPMETGFVPIFLARTGDHAFAEALEAGRAWREAYDADAETFREQAWTAPLDDVRTHIAKGVTSFWSWLFGDYRRASRELKTLTNTPLPARAAARLALIDRMVLIRRLRETLAHHANMLAAVLGEAWRGERTDFGALVATRTWSEGLLALDADVSAESANRLAMIREDAVEIHLELTKLHHHATAAIGTVRERLGLDAGPKSNMEGQSLPALRERFARMSNELGRYAEWVALARKGQVLSAAGLTFLVEGLESGHLPPERAIDEFRYAVAEARWSHARSMLPELDEIGQLNRHELVQKFRELDRARTFDVQTLILAKHLEQLPTGAAGEMGFIRGEIAKKRGHKPIRQVIDAAGRMIQRIKPVFLMSPISVAQFLPPDSLDFDLLVIDEASQVRPEDALGAIARSKQIVVVGDQKQLPPTSFFDRLTDNIPDDDQEEHEIEGVTPGTAMATEMESILTLCEARGVRPEILEWHYRSRDPSLIRVSNAEFYANRLILPPSPLQMDRSYGLRFNRVPGVYSSRSRGGGRPGTNQIEAEHVAAALAAHARDWPTLSIGVVAFSKAQSDMITQVLEVLRRNDEVLDRFLREGKVEDVFVKNIENVQGDERDVILISVGYGPHEPNGRLTSMNFGPVNGEGGERRLNVLFSRARLRCEVLASFEPGEIDVTRTSREGPRVLKRFLEFAKTGEFDEKLITNLDADSPFEEDVARVIESFGFHADPQVGCAGFRLDIGVRHPARAGAYILAVECDGATYHGALWARERDRLRQDILENLGWSFHRIWSTDWFHRRTQEISRLRLALESAKTAQSRGVAVRGANENRPAPIPAAPPSDPSIDLYLLAPSLKAPAYRKAKLKARGGRDPHEVPPSEMTELVARVVEEEGPIHADEVARRIATAFSKQRTGRRIQEAVNEGLRIAHHAGRITAVDSFWVTPAQQATPPVRDRSHETIPTTKAEYLSPLEIRAAARIIETECGKVGQDDMVRTIARLLGFLRVGRELRDAIVDALK